jgi:NAD+ synthase (glutamine-hydrolysing)
MSQSLRVAMAQCNPLVGDVAANADAIIDSAQRARDELGAAVVVFPELMVTGYPPDDLLLRADFLAAADQAVDRVCQSVHGITLVVGAPRCGPHGLENVAYICRDGTILGRYAKQELPTYGVFDERRYFTPGTTACVVEAGGARIGVTICEDAWYPAPVRQAADAGAQLLVNINASPFDQRKWEARQAALKDRVAEVGLPIVYCNMAGGQDDVVYDGASCALDADGALRQRAPRFDTGLYPVEVAVGEYGCGVEPGTIAAEEDAAASIYQALVCGVRDYIEKNGFPGALIGLSGGMDSALTACIAADALGPERVECVMMPTRYTSEMSHTDAATVADNLGVHYSTVAIEGIFGAFMEAVAPVFGDAPPDVTEENLQSRARGTLLMALSNKGGKLVLATGNKSEMAVGYATLYGDMVGGFSPLKDVYKTAVYRVARYRNSLSAVLPENLFVRPPSAELRHDQKDTDSLPDYGILDGILERYVEQDAAIPELVEAGYDRATVERVARLVRVNEYKRRQAPPGVKVTTRAFGRERRYPVTSGFRG